MGYNLTIGNAKPFFDKDEDYLEAKWVVQKVEHTSAPTFPGDEMTGRTNCRYPSYSAWHDFCIAANLEDVFYENDRFIGGHPGCAMLKAEYLSQIKASLEKRRAESDKKPGFNDEDDGPFDPILARLIWLNYWVEWALNNCETPAIENS